MCEVLKISRSSFYKYLNKTESKRSVENKMYEEEILKIYIYTLKDGWCYLASVLDLHTKKIIGYAFSKTMDTELAIKAVENAYITQKPKNTVILHSDLGSQYTSSKFDDYHFLSVAFNFTMNHIFIY